MSERLDLGAMFSPDPVAALEQPVDEPVATALASMSAETNDAAPWLTLEQAAERLGCSFGCCRLAGEQVVCERAKFVAGE